MDPKDIGRITSELQNKYPDIGIKNIELDASGKASFFLRQTPKALAFLKRDAVRPHVSTGAATTVRRTPLDRTSLDLSITTSPYNQDIKDVYTRSMKYYYEDDAYGTSIDVLTNFASKGFENDIDDDDIKLFYDVWCFDVNFKQLLQWMFFDFFRVGMVRTYKIIGKYEPGITYLSNVPGQKVSRGVLQKVMTRASRINNRRLKNLDAEMKALDGRNADQNLLKQELAAKKKVWSKGFMPISYTVLNPLLVDLDGSLLFDKSKTTLTPSDELKKLLQKPGNELTDDEKEIIKLLPSDFKAAVLAGGGIALDPMFVGAVDYRKMPYERYARPRGIKAFDSIEYKRALREADLSTLDGISNYILKVTVGNDEYPITDQSQLEAAANLFDTPSKSFDVVWNHTLSVEKIVSPEIEAVLGEKKYAQVNMDITGAVGVSRALIDGMGKLTSSEATLITKTVLEEISYARSQVTRWVYNEYQQIAEAVGFDRFPKVRWDNTILRDVILYMSTISQLVDRRMLSYETALEQLGFDFENEFNNMQKELPAVMKGVLGILGSPFQQSAQQPGGAPRGTPSGGRPKGKPAKKKTPNTSPKATPKKQSPSQSTNPTKKTASLQEVVKDMTADEYEMFLDELATLRE